MAEGTRFRDLQDSVTAFKLHQEKTTSNLEQATEGLRKQQEQMQAQTNLHDKKLDDLAEKMDKLIEVLGNLQTQKHQTEGRIYQENQEKEFKLYQASQKKLRDEQEEAYQRKQEENQEYLRSWDNLLEIMQELAQEEERNEQLKKAEEKIEEQEQNTFETAESSNPLGGIDDQTAESIGDFNPNGVHNDEFLDLSREIESMEFKKVLLISEKVEIKEEIKKLKMEQEFVPIFSKSYGLYCNANDMFDRKLKRKWVAGVFYLWGGSWCFDPGKKLIFLEEIPSYLNQHNDCKAGASDLSKNLESMELEKLQLKDGCKEKEMCQGQFCFFDARPVGFVSEQRSWILWRMGSLNFCNCCSTERTSSQKNFKISNNNQGLPITLLDYFCSWDGISRISKIGIFGTGNDSSKLFDPGKILSFPEDVMLRVIRGTEGSMRCRDSFNSEEQNYWLWLYILVHLFFFPNPNTEKCGRRTTTPVLIHIIQRLQRLHIKPRG